MLPEYFNNIEIGAFMNSKLKEIKFNGNIPNIGKDAFKNTSLTIYYNKNKNWKNYQNFENFKRKVNNNKIVYKELVIVTPTTKNSGINGAVISVIVIFSLVVLVAIGFVVYRRHKARINPSSLSIDKHYSSKRSSFT